MTDAHHPQEHDGSHDGPIRTPKQLILAVLWAHIVPIGGILLLVAYVTAHNRPAAGSDALAAAAIAKRIQPVGRVEVRDASDVASLKTGEQVFAAPAHDYTRTLLAAVPPDDPTEVWLGLRA